MIVYLAHNKITAQNYVGQSNFSLEKRKSEHQRSIKKYYFNNSIKKYGKENFLWSVLRDCETQEELNFWEDFYIRLLMSNNKGCGYNLKTGGSNGKLSEETKKKISEANKKRPYPSFETREKIRLSKLGNQYSKNRTWTEEQKLESSKRKKEWAKEHPEIIEKLRLMNLGKKHSEEAKKKIGEKSKGNKNCLGRKATEEARENMSKAHMGKKLTEETKMKMREALIRRWENRKKQGFEHRIMSDEEKAMRSEAGKKHYQDHPERRIKLGISSKGNKYRLGHKDSEETKQKKRISGKIGWGKRRLKLSA